MTDIQPKEVFDILLESLKIQAEKYKTIVSQDALTHDQRKDFDAEIKQMYELLSNMTNSSTVYTLAEIQQLKVQYELRIQELQTTLDNIDVTTVKGDTGEQGIQGVQGLKGDKGDKGDAGLQGIQGEKGDQGIQGLKGDTGSQGIQGEKGEKGDQGIQGLNGIDGTHGLDGDDGLSAYQIALNNGFVGSEIQWLESLKGATGEKGLDGINGIDGKDFTYDMFTPQQLELLKGADGQNGINGINGQDGAVTFESLTPEQIALLKGEKGDTGLQGIQGQNGTNGLDGDDGLSAYQIALNNGFVGSEAQWLVSLKGQNGTNGIDGQDGNSLTYNDLTLEQKQEFANLVPVSGGGSSLTPKSSTVLFENQIKANGNNHVKTSFKPNSSFTVEYHYFINSTHNFRQSRKLFFNFDTTLTIKDVLITESGSFVTAYLSNDGYLCFYISGASYFSLFEFTIVSTLPNDSLEDVIFTVLNNTTSSIYYPSLTASNYLLLKAGTL